MTEPTRTYCNPICVAHPGSSRDDSPEPLIIGDPFVLRHDGEYFLYGTTDPSTGFRVFRSNDLVTWVEMGFALQSNADTWGGPPFWAPEVLAHRGRFYMTYSASDASTGLLLTALAVADNPLGPFTDLHCPWFDLGYSAIDTHLFVDDEDVYAFFSRNGEQDGYSFGVIYGAPVAQDLSGLSDAPRVLLQADQDWERINFKFNRANEGPFVLKHGGTYYMTYSANHTFLPGYGIGVATAAHPMGPWSKSVRNPVASSDTLVGYSGAGHNSIVESPNRTELFAVYHTHADPAHPENEKRHLNVDRVRILDDGSFEFLGPTRRPQPIPA